MIEWMLMLSLPRLADSGGSDRGGEAGAGRGCTAAAAPAESVVQEQAAK